MSDARYFEPYLDPKALPSITQSFNEALVGTVNVSGGSFTLLNGNGLFDQLLDKYIWLNRKVTIKRGYDDQDYADYATMNVVTISSWKMDPQKVQFKTKNKFNVLFEEIPAATFSSSDATTFGGTTYGSTYPEKLLGKPKPLAWGEFNERQAPVMHMVREDLDFANFTANYDTVSKTDSNMGPTAPAYNPDVTFTASGITTNDDGYVRSFIPAQSGDYFNQEDGFYKGYYIRVPGLSEQAKVASYSYDRTEDAAEFTLDVSDEDNRITSASWPSSQFKLYCPVYHFFLANHTIKSIENIYVDKGGEDGVREWIYLATETDFVGLDWYRVVIPIHGYSSSTNAMAAFKSKDVDGGSSTAKETLENHSDVVEDILINTGVLSAPFAPGDLDSASFAASRTDRNYPVAIYLKEPIKAIEVLKGIRQSVIAKLMFTPGGKIKYVAWNPENPVAAGIEELTISEILGDVVFEALLIDIYYGFIVMYGQDGQEEDYLEERYVYDPTKYLYKTTETKIIETYLRNSSHAQRTAQRYTYFNRNLITKFSLKLPHNILRDGTFADSVHTPGEYIRVTDKRAPGQESAYGGEFGQYRKTYEVLKVQDSSSGLSLGGDNIKNLSISSGYWSNSDGDEPTGYWTNAAGESVPGDDSTKNTSLWT